MENTRKFTFDLETIAWGALFILWGILEMFKFLPDGTGALGIGLILIGLNIARAMTQQPISSFTTTIGILALLAGGLKIASPYLHFSFEIPVFAILLLALGMILLGGAEEEIVRLANRDDSHPGPGIGDHPFTDRCHSDQHFFDGTERSQVKEKQPWKAQ